MFYAILPQRALIAVSGADRQAFLQGVVTANAAKLPTYSALLTPQGKFLHDFFMVEDGERILLDCEAARSDDLFKRLNFYKLRADVKVERAEQGVVAVWGAPSLTLPPSGGGKFIKDPRLPELGFRLIGDVKILEQWCGAQGYAPGDYNAMRIGHGVPDGHDLIVDKSIILHFGFDKLHGVDFTKGCYIGQEVIARTHYKGEIRKYIFQVRADAELPLAGTPVLQGEIEVGEMRSHAGNVGLALLRTEAVENGAALTAGGMSTRAAWPDWAGQPAK